MSLATPDIDEALRRLLVDLAHAAALDEWQPRAIVEPSMAGEVRLSTVAQHEPVGIQKAA